MSKNYRKSLHQKDMLLKFFSINPGPWQPEDISQLSLKTGMSKHKVYKYLWDQRKKNERSMREGIPKQIDYQYIKKASLSSQSEIFKKYPIDPDLQVPGYMQEEQNWQTVKYKGCEALVPKEVQHCVEIIVPRNLDPKYVLLLEQNAWMIIKGKKSSKGLKSPVKNYFSINQKPNFSPNTKERLEMMRQKIRRSRRMSKNLAQAVNNIVQTSQVPIVLLNDTFKGNIVQELLIEQRQEALEELDYIYETPERNPKENLIEDEIECQNRKSKTKYFDIKGDNLNQDRIFEYSSSKKSYRIE